MRILVSNDDGIHARGLRTLSEKLAQVGEVWVTAPDREQSATSHAISLNVPLRSYQTAAREHAITGTPTDSVYLGLNHILKEPPDVVVSGINHGPNLGNDVIYSGTVSAAMEAAMFGYQAIAVSLCIGDHAGVREMYFDSAAEFAARLVVAMANKPLPRGVLLNVNVPNRPIGDIRGMKVCRLGFNNWADRVAERLDPRGRPYYWIGGTRQGHDAIPDSDVNAVADGFVAVTPIHYDLTDYRSFAATRAIEVEGFSRAPDQLGDTQLPHSAAKS
ncbi:MAG: 5'/3'-nucleotidase SurE [Clostridia bacterium]|nr:5'/3'-nucleotidase SurE [Deltaproteobacteria bacterium]